MNHHFINVNHNIGVCFIVEIVAKAYDDGLITEEEYNKSRQKILDAIEEREDNLLRAIAAFEVTSVYLTPQTAPLYYANTQNNLGIAYEDLADIEEREANLRRAIEAYTNGINTDPRNTNCFWGRGSVYYDLGIDHYRDAIADYRRYEELTGALKPFMAERIGEMEAALDHEG